jgi:hypothetical protein
MIVPRHVLGRGLRAPSDILNIATVGINGQGAENTLNAMYEKHRRHLRRWTMPCSTRS